MKCCARSIFLIFTILTSSTFCVAQIQWDTLYLENEMSPNYTKDIMVDNLHYMWISTARGLYRIDGYEARYYVNNPEDTLSLVNNVVTKVYQDEDNALWILTDKGVQFYNYKKETFHPVLEDYIEEQKDSLFKYGFECAQQVDQKHILFGTKDGCVLFNKFDWSYQYFPILKSSSTEGYSSLAHVIEIVKDPNDHALFYLLTKSGIYTFTNRTKKIKSIFNDASIDFASIGPPGLSMVEHQGYLYFIVRKEVYSYQISSGKYAQIGMNQIPNRDIVVRDIMISYDGKLIVSTSNNGIYESNLEAPHQPKLIEEGLYNQMAMDPDGKLITIANTSTIVISKKQWGSKAGIEPVLNIDKIWVNDNRKLLREVYQDSIYQLRDFERNLQFKVSANHSNPNDQFVYYYQLDRDPWEKVQVDRKLSLMNMTPGQHSIVFKTEHDGKSLYAQEFKLNIDRYFYEKWWFRILLFSTVVFFIAAIYYLLRSLKRNREQYKRQVIEMELNALRSQMNPHFLFNTLNSIKNYVLTKSPDDAAYYLTKFAQLIRSILENSKVPFLSLQQEIDSNKLYIEMEHLRFGGEFESHIDVDEEIDTLQFKIAPMLIQPFIENAIWHGLMNIKTDRQLWIRFEKTEKGVLCIIEDNGIGLSKSKELQAKRNQRKKSLGLDITLERIKNINLLYNIDAHVDIADRHPCGTIVKINLPSLDTQSL